MIGRSDHRTAPLAAECGEWHPTEPGCVCELRSVHPGQHQGRRLDGAWLSWEKK